MKFSLRKNCYAKKFLLMILVVILSSFAFQLYNYQHEKNKFNIIFKYGVEEKVNLLLFQYNIKGKNVLNTLNDTFVKDLIEDGKIKTKLVLTENEMNEIETYITQKNIMNYPDKITYESLCDIGRGKSYLTIYSNGQKKTIEWTNLGFGKDYTEKMKNQVKFLNELWSKIVDFITTKEEFKKLPAAKGGYM